MIEEALFELALEAIFELALKAPEAARGELLDRECAGNAELRARIEARLADESADQPTTPDVEGIMVNSDLLISDNNYEDQETSHAQFLHLFDSLLHETRMKIFFAPRSESVVTRELIRDIREKLNLNVPHNEISQTQSPCELPGLLIAAKKANLNGNPMRLVEEIAKSGKVKISDLEMRLGLDDVLSLVKRTNRKLKKSSWKLFRLDGQIQAEQKVVEK